MLYAAIFVFLHVIPVHIILPWLYEEKLLKKESIYSTTNSYSNYKTYPFWDCRKLQNLELEKLKIKERNNRKNGNKKL